MTDLFSDLWIVDPNPLRRAAFLSVLAPIALPDGVSVKAAGADHSQSWAAQASNRSLALVILGGESLASDAGRRMIDPLRETAPTLAMAVLLDAITAPDIELALSLRLRGLICTQDEPGVALAAIRFLIAGGYYVPHDRAYRPQPEPNPAAEPAVAHDAAPLPVVPDPALNLTPRQEEVFAVLARGASNKSIARTLNLSEATVKIHVRHILQKLSVKNRVQAALHARNALQKEAGGAMPRMKSAQGR